MQAGGEGLSAAGVACGAEGGRWEGGLGEEGRDLAIATWVEDLGGDGVERSFASRPCGEERLKVGGDKVREEGRARRRQTHCPPGLWEGW